MQNDATARPDDTRQFDPTDLADRDRLDAAWAAWIAANPELANEVDIARNVRLMLESLRAADFVVPADFEARVLQRLQRDTSFLALLDLGLFKTTQALFEFLNVIFDLFPSAPRREAAR